MVYDWKTQKKASRLGRPFFLSAAAAAIVVVVVAAVIAAIAAVAQQQDQDDDPPPVIAAETSADAVIVAHRITSGKGFELCCSFHGIPLDLFCARKYREISLPVCFMVTSLIRISFITVTP